MINIINNITKIKKNIKKSSNINELNLIKKKVFGKNGFFFNLIQSIKNFSKDKKPLFGKLVNKFKKEITECINNKFYKLNNIKFNNIKFKKIDISLPGRNIVDGTIHPISNIILKIIKFFNKFGFMEISGNEIEDKYHNFQALNITENHPAYNSNDTFWINSNILLRTQTSNIQIRTMKNYNIPIKIISSGKVYRKDLDKTHTPMFHQIEGILVDVNISFSNLKWIIFNFLNDFFNKKLKIRFRTSYFPFTQISAEVDILDKNGNWLEVLGCGMIHPNVLKNVNININKYSGYAFGIGVERIAMLFYNISDVRLFFKNDLRFLKQFI